jgi:uncharacterized protein with FMN-binding domain
MSNTKKYIIAGVIVVAVVVFIIFANDKNMPIAANTSADGGTTSAPSETTNPATTPTSTGGDTTGNGTTASASKYKDGTYTGAVENAVYGNIQAKITISGGKITDVEIPVYPNSLGHTSDVSASTIPVLKAEALAAQSANVQIVSGATQDTQAFQQSLADALSQAAA